MVVTGLAAIEKDGRLIFSSNGLPKGLYEYGLKTSKMTKISRLSGEIGEGLYHRRAYLNGNHAWFVPWDGYFILCIDLENGNEEYISFDDGTSNHGFVNYLRYGKDGLLLIPGGDVRSLVFLDPALHQLKVFHNVISTGQCIGAYLFSDIVFFVNGEGDFCSEFDVGKWQLISTYETRELSNDTDPDYSSLIQSENKIYLVPWKSENICIIDADTKEREYIALPDKKEYFSGGISLDQWIVMFPRDDSGRYLQINKKTKEIVMKEYKTDMSVCGWNEMCPVESDSLNNLVISLDGKLLEFNENGDIVKEICYLRDEKEIEDVSIDNGEARKQSFDWYTNNKKIIRESKEFDLKNYIEVIK